MQLDPTLLSEKNYTGTRLILIEDEKLGELWKKKTEIQTSINPTLDKLKSELWDVLDEDYKELSVLNEKSAAIKEKIKDMQAKYAAELEKVQSAEQKARAIEDKIRPIVLKAIEGKLGEFETAKNTIVRDGKVYAEVYDEIEERVKAIRVQKANAKK